MLHVQVGKEALQHLQPFKMTDNNSKLAIRADWLRQLQVRPHLYQKLYTSYICCGAASPLQACSCNIQTMLHAHIRIFTAMSVVMRAVMMRHMCNCNKMSCGVFAGGCC